MYAQNLSELIMSPDVHSGSSGYDAFKREISASFFSLEAGLVIGFGPRNNLSYQAEPPHAVLRKTNFMYF